MLQEKYSIINPALLSVVRKNPFLFEGLTGKCYKINKMYCKTLEYMVYCTENVDLTQYRAKKLAN